MKYIVLFLLLINSLFAVDYYIATPYAAADLALIQYVQINDVMYLFHPDYAPYKLTRIADNSWTCAAVDWQWGPFLDQNTTTTTITPSGVTGSVTLTASASIFDADHVGSIWEIITKASDTTIQGNLASATTSSNLSVEGEYLLTLKGSFVGLVKLERSNDSFVTTDSVYIKYNSDGSAIDIEYSGNEANSGYEYRVNMSSWTSGSVDYSLVAYNDEQAGYVEITAYSSGTSVTATVQSDLASATATAKWSEGAWSDYRGWPRAACVYQNRLFTAGTYYMPNGIWSSVAGGDYENFLDGSDADDAIVYEPAVAKQNPIVWMQDRNGVVCGTSGNVIRVYAGDYTSALTPGNIASERQGDSSSSSIQAALLNESMIYVDRNGRRVSDSVFNKESDSFIPVDLTVFSPEITDPSITEIAVQERPDPILWCIRSDGNLLSLTYNTAQGVSAWAVHSTDGDFKSVACIPGDDEDEVWVVVERTINSSTVRYVERIKPQDWGDDQNDCWFVDAGYHYSGASTDTITGLTWLEGETVQVFKGDSYETATVSSGSITLSEAVTECTVGLGYTSNIVTFPVEIQSNMGFTIGKKKAIRSVFMAAYQAMNCEYREYGESWYAVDFQTSTLDYIGTTEPYTGLFQLPWDGGFQNDREVQIQLRQTAPYPMGMTALVTNLELGDD